MGREGSRGSQWRRARAGGGAGLGGFLVVGGALVAAAVGAGLTVRASRKKEGCVTQEGGGEWVARGEGYAKVEEPREEEPSALGDQSPPSPQSPELTPPPPASSEDDNDREIGEEHVEAAPLSHSVPESPMEKNMRRTHGPLLEDHVELQIASVVAASSGGGLEDRQENEILYLENTTTEEEKDDHIDDQDGTETDGSSLDESERDSDSGDSDAYIKWPAEGTDSSHSSSCEEEEEEDADECGMKSSFDAKDNGKELPPKNRTLDGEGKQGGALGTVKKMVVVKDSDVYLRLALSLVVLAICLLLLDRHHRAPVETFRHLRTFLHRSDGSS